MPPRSRIGLSFVLAPAEPAHANRTDIACFVGTVARRRRAATGLVPLPVPLLRWLAANGFAQIEGVPLTGLTVDLASRSSLAASLRARAGARRAELDGLFNPPAGPAREALRALVAACRDFSPLPVDLVDELAAREYLPRGAAAQPAAAWLRLQALANLPVAVESFDQFSALYAWETRAVLERVPRPGDPMVACPLGAAVRAFFGEGGRRCHIVRTGDAPALFASTEERFVALAGDAGHTPPLRGVKPRFSRGLLADVDAVLDPAAAEPARWQGVDHLLGLPEVSFLCLPDLADACAQAIPRVLAPAEALVVEERFRECAPPVETPDRAVGRRLPPPRLTALGLKCWRKLAGHALDLLDNGGRAFNRRDVQLIASLPLAGEGRRLPSREAWSEWLADPDQAFDADRLQLAYPWLATRQSDDCQGGLEAPEGSLAGVLARSALARGSYRSAAHEAVHRFIASEPPLDPSLAATAQTLTRFGPVTLAERVCLVTDGPNGPELLSDVTTAQDPRRRAGSVRRLLNVVIREARRLGEETAFEPSGEVLWARLRARLEDLGRVLAAAGALSSDAGAGAFVVRCGRDTMTEADLEAGRLIAEVDLVPAQPIVRIVVTLALRGGQASLRAAA